MDFRVISPGKSYGFEIHEEKDIDIDNEKEEFAKKTEEKTPSVMDLFVENFTPLKQEFSSI